MTTARAWAVIWTIETAHLNLAVGADRPGIRTTRWWDSPCSHVWANVLRTNGCLAAHYYERETRWPSSGGVCRPWNTCYANQVDTGGIRVRYRTLASTLAH